MTHIVSPSARARILSDQLGKHGLGKRTTDAGNARQDVAVSHNESSGSPTTTTNTNTAANEKPTVAEIQPLETSILPNAHGDTLSWIFKFQVKDMYYRK